VTVVEGARALGREDPELAGVVLDSLRAEGIAIREGQGVVKIAGQQGAVEVVLADGSVIARLAPLDGGGAAGGAGRHGA
jgi:pyruvate/2-oxoglutarate dehydrogenase complex dihydrolipoamide dehydrogenase (E3) component